jgi:hypothetical protein
MTGRGATLFLLRKLARNFERAGLITLLSCCTATTTASVGQKAKCSDVHLLARMARTRWSPLLKQLGTLIGGSYCSKLIFAFRVFEIDQADTDSGYCRAFTGKLALRSLRASVLKEQIEEGSESVPGQKIADFEKYNWWGGDYQITPVSY